MIVGLAGNPINISEGIFLSIHRELGNITITGAEFGLNRCWLWVWRGREVTPAAVFIFSRVNN